MESLVYFKLKSLSLMNKAKAEATRLGGLLENKYGDAEVDTYYIGFKSGDAEPKSTSNGTIAFNSPIVSEQFDDFAQTLAITKEQVCFVLKLRSDDPGTAQTLLEEKMEEIVTMATAMIPDAEDFIDGIEFSYGVDGEYVRMAIVCNIPLVTEMVDEYTGMVDSILGDKFSATIESEGKWGKNIKELLESKISEVYSNFEAQIVAKINGHVIKNFINGLMEGSSVVEHLKPQHMAMALGFLLKGAKIQLNFGDFDAKSMAQGTPMAAMTEIPIKDLLTQFAPMASQIIGGQPIIKDILEFFRDNIKCDVGLMLHAPKGIFSMNFKTEGFKQLYEIFMPAE